MVEIKVYSRFGKLLSKDKIVDGIINSGVDIWNNIKLYTRGTYLVFIRIDEMVYCEKISVG